MDPEKLALDLISAEAMRNWAASIPVAVENINEDTNRLLSVYQSVEESLGVHRENFLEVLRYVQQAQSMAAEAIQMLPPKLEEVAQKVEDYVYHQVKSSSELKAVKEVVLRYGGSGSANQPVVRVRK